MILKMRIIKWSIIVLVTVVLIYFSGFIGYKITGDLHNGGPIVGLILTPIVAFLLILLFFLNEIKLRNLSILLLSTYITFFGIFFILSFLLNNVLQFIIKEYYVISKIWVWITITNIFLTSILTTFVFFWTRKILRENVA